MRVTKGELARQRHVSPSCVSVWVRNGLPVGDDGLVDFDDAAAWVREHVQPQVRVSRAAKIAATGVELGREPSVWPEAAQAGALEIAVAALDLAGVERVDMGLLLGVANAGLSGACEAAQDLAVWLAERKAGGRLSG